MKNRDTYYFLNAASLLAKKIGVLFLAFFFVFAIARAEEPFRAVLISDTHLGIKKSDQAFADFLQDVESLPFKPSVLINNGDVTEIGVNDIFDDYQKSVHSVFPTAYSVIGNHDTRWNPEGKKAYAMRVGPLHFSKDFAGIHWMFLDSTIEHQTQGHVDFREMRWIKNDLTHVPADEPILVFSHHPFKWRGTSVDDGFDVIKRFSGHDVAAYFNGHGHKLVNLSFQGIPFIENDALFNRHYIILEKNGDEISLSVKTIGEPEPKPWLSFSLHPKKTDEPFPAKLDLPKGIKSIPIGEIYAGLAADEKHVYAGTLGGNLAAVNGVGKILWKQNLDGDILAAPAVSAGLVVVGTKGGTLYGINAADGEVRWSVKNGFPFAASPAIANGTVYIGSGDKNIYAYELLTGKEKWHTLLGNFTEMKPAVAQDMVFVGAWDQTFYALDEKDGRVIWKTPIGKAVYYSPSVAEPVPAKAWIYVAAKDHFVYKLLQLDGKMEWQQPSNDSFSSPIINLCKIGEGDMGELLLPEVNGQILSINAANGEKLWSKKLNTEFYNASPVQDKRFIDLIGVHGDYIKLDCQTDDIVEQIKFSSGWTFSTPVLLDGKLWVGSLDGNLYAIPK